MGSAIHNNNILYTYIEIAVYYTTPTAPAFILLLLPLLLYRDIYHRLSESRDLGNCTCHLNNLAHFVVWTRYYIIPTYIHIHNVYSYKVHPQQEGWSECTQVGRPYRT